MSVQHTEVECSKSAVKKPNDLDRCSSVDQRSSLIFSYNHDGTWCPACNGLGDAPKQYPDCSRPTRTPHNDVIDIVLFGISYNRFRGVAFLHCRFDLPIVFARDFVGPGEYFSPFLDGEFVRRFVWVLWELRDLNDVKCVYLRFREEIKRFPEGSFRFRRSIQRN